MALGRSGRLNFLCDPIAAGNGGAENIAATTLMRVIHECICSVFLIEKKGHSKKSVHTNVIASNIRKHVTFVWLTAFPR